MHTCCSYASISASAHAYIQILLSLRQCAEQLSNSQDQTIPLVVLEPQADAQLLLPLRPATIATASQSEPVAAGNGKSKVGQTPRKPQRIKHMSIKEILEWTFGRENVMRCVVEGESEPDVRAACGGES